MLETFASCLQVFIYDICSVRRLVQASADRPIPIASGDLRNVIKTITELPTSYNHPLEVTINDIDFDIVARNLILLLIALVVENPDEAVDCMIHLWYSSLVRETDIDTLRKRIQPLIMDVCKKIEDKPSERLLAKTWTFKGCSLRIALNKPSWNRVLSLFNTPHGLTADQALRIRAKNTLAYSRKDYRDRYMTFLSPSQRVSYNKFRQDGLLLPFGHPRHDFTQPNPCVSITSKAYKRPLLTIGVGHFSRQLMCGR